MLLHCLLTSLGICKKTRQKKVYNENMNKTWVTKLHYDVKNFAAKNSNISMELFKHETLIYSLSRWHQLPVLRFIQSNDNSFVAKSAIYLYNGA